jgi:hypothetical protein
MKKINRQNTYGSQKKTFGKSQKAKGGTRSMLRQESKHVNPCKILEVGNLLFPLADINKKFVVEDTLQIEIPWDKNYERFLFILPQFISRILWKEICERNLHKKYRNCWLCPVHWCAYGDILDVSIDVLRPIHDRKKQRKRKEVKSRRTKI